MNKKILLTLILGIFLFSFVSAASIGTKQINKPMKITNYCQIGSCTYMNLTSLTLPNGTLINMNTAMAKNIQDFSYDYTPTLLGTYYFTTCGNPNGIVCDSDNFLVTPSGNSGNSNIVFFILVIVLLYSLTFISFFNKIPSLTALSGMALGGLGLYIVNNGIIIYRDWLTNYIAYITISFGFILGLWALIEWIQDSI